MVLAWSSLNYRLRKMNVVCRKIALTESNRAAAAAVGLDVLGDEEEVFVPGGPAAQHGCHGSRTPLRGTNKHRTIPANLF